MFFSISYCYQISGVVYFNYEVVQKLYSLILYAPIEGCTYIGIDNGASSLSVSYNFKR